MPKEPTMPYDADAGLASRRRRPGGLPLTGLEGQRAFLFGVYKVPAPCPICSTEQTPYEASGDSFAVDDAHKPFPFVCVSAECRAPLAHIVPLVAFGSCAYQWVLDRDRVKKIAIVAKDPIVSEGEDHYSETRGPRPVATLGRRDFLAMDRKAQVLTIDLYLEQATAKMKRAGRESGVRAHPYLLSAQRFAEEAARCARFMRGEA